MKLLNKFIISTFAFSFSIIACSSDKTDNSINKISYPTNLHALSHNSGGSGNSNGGGSGGGSSGGSSNGGGQPPPVVAPPPIFVPPPVPNIAYHGGPIIPNTVDVYLIWYGDWTNNTATTIIPKFFNDLSGSPWFAINKSYTGVNGAPNGLVNLAGQTFDSGSLGLSLSDLNVESIVSNVLAVGTLPTDLNAVYFVLTSKDVAETSGFCSVYCGYHNVQVIATQNIKFAFVGDPSTCLDGCAGNTVVSPNGNLGADAMLSVIAHELSEATTDPELSGYFFDADGEECADRCVFQFQPESVDTNGAAFNMTLNSSNYLVQNNWNKDKLACSLTP